jgi:predicted enzyme related to lactoylglutathione lyase
MRFMIHATRGDDHTFAYARSGAEALTAATSLDDGGWRVEISDLNGQAFTVEEFSALTDAKKSST